MENRTAFCGNTYEPELDFVRLTKQKETVAALMSDGEWRTLREIYRATDYPEASISARLRDLRKAGNRVEKERIGDPERGLWAYRLVVLGAQ